MSPFISGAQAGLSEQEQMNICLRFILSQGGLAATSQLYKVIEGEIQKRIGSDYFLSENGKAFIRALINNKAVEKGYIRPYDPNRPGWWLTEEGERYALSIGGTGKRSPTAWAYVNFKIALEEVRILLNNASQATVKDLKSASLKAALILTVTAWETYVEEIFRTYRDYLLSLSVSSPSEHPQLSKMFNRAANQWFEGKPRKPSDLEAWIGDGWKERLRETTDRAIASLNTPKCANLSKLFKWVGWNITQSWGWSHFSAAKICEKIDEIVSKRGELAHSSGDLLSRSAQVRANFVHTSVQFFERLVEWVESAIRSKMS